MDKDLAVRLAMVEANVMAIYYGLATVFTAIAEGDPEIAAGISPLLLDMADAASEQDDGQLGVAGSKNLPIWH